MKYYFCRFDEKGDPIVLSFHEEKNEAETENARYITEAELPAIQQRMDEIIAENTEPDYIEMLEAENAALLFQILTGEEYTDV